MISLYQLASKIPFLVFLKRLLDRLELIIFGWQRKFKRFFRTLGWHNNQQPLLPIGIFCVKKIEYAHMAVLNVNSLHYYNQTFPVIIYCDQLCADFLSKNLSQFDYPKLVTVVSSFQEITKPWQYYRLQALKLITKESGLLVDADSRWFAAPQLDRNKALLLTAAYRFSDKPAESKLLEKVVTDPAWEKTIHYASGIVYLPSDRFTQDSFAELFTLYEKLHQHSDTPELKRLCDEIAINIFIQLKKPGVELKVLKDKDGPGNKNILQSYYYGCWNQITE